MRELIAYLGNEELAAGSRRLAEALLFDLLEPAPIAMLHVPLPSDPRARDLADALINAPDDDRDLGAWGLEVGASIRTLSRLFTAETGMSFAQWRAHVRMRAALELLADGCRWRRSPDESDTGRRARSWPHSVASPATLPARRCLRDRATFALA
jgi:AraC-like DNA-binding protein